MICSWPEKGQEQIKSLRRHRESVEQQVLSVRNRLEAATHSPWADREVLRSLRSTIRHLEKQAEAAESKLQQLISEDETYSTLSNLLQTIPGVGLKTAQLLLAEMPPVWQCDSSRAWVAFAGVCPQPFQSGYPRSHELTSPSPSSTRRGLRPTHSHLECVPKQTK